MFHAKMMSNEIEQKIVVPDVLKKIQDTNQYSLTQIKT